MKTEDTEALGSQGATPRSKPDTVDQPVRTARTFIIVHNTVAQRQFS